jgi:AcrR family transcriptional regulator
MSKAAEKKDLILRGAKKVFIRKGFSSVTMKDIIEECGISRGGIYLYFSNVEEVFTEVVKKHNEEKIRDIQANIEKNQDFNRSVDDFFAEQKEKLLNMDKSLFVAMIEFCFSHKNSSNRDFYTEQFHNTKVIIMEMLKFGQKKQVVAATDIDRLADSIMFLIEGLRSLSVSSRISEKLVESQLRVCREMIDSDLFQEGKT